jgi:hypothetical protein
VYTISITKRVLQGEILQATKAQPVQIKQLYVLAALEVEKARNINEQELSQVHGLTMLGGGFAAGSTITASDRAQHTLQGLVTLDQSAVQVSSWNQRSHHCHLRNRNCIFCLVSAVAGPNLSYRVVGIRAQAIQFEQPKQIRRDGLISPRGQAPHALTTVDDCRSTGREFHG